MATERVYAICEYYDGIRTGVADYLGNPHYFEQEWSAGLQDYLPTFLLKPIAKEILADAIEQWEIFCRWKAKFHGGEVSADTHPGLPGQEARYLELQARLEAAIKKIVFGVRAKGEFSRASAAPRSTRVTWERMSGQ